MFTLPGADQRVGPKPNGLWVSVGDSWKQWSECEEFRLDNLAQVSEVVLKEDALVLHISTYGQLQDFAREYRAPSPEWSRSDSSYMQSYWMDWARVASEFQGILIAPYSWSARHDYMWYNGWDCASGCIWDAEALDMVLPMTHEDVMRDGMYDDCSIQ
jgi:hypothetical protein